MQDALYGPLLDSLQLLQISLVCGTNPSLTHTCTVCGLRHAAHPGTCLGFLLFPGSFVLETPMSWSVFQPYVHTPYTQTCTEKHVSQSPLRPQSLSSTCKDSPGPSAASSSHRVLIRDPHTALASRSLHLHSS